MAPSGRDQYLFTRPREYRKTSSRIVVHILLHVDNRFTLPDFVQLRGRPSAVLANTVNMPLAADRLIAKRACRVGDHTKKQHAFFELRPVRQTRHVHRDGIYLFRPFAVRIAQRRADLIQCSDLRHRPGNILSVAKTERLTVDGHIKAIVSHGAPRNLPRRQRSAG